MTLPDLESKARAATPGPWRHEWVRESPQTKEFAMQFIYIGNQRWSANRIPYSLEEYEADFNSAAFIAAASPQTILKLCKLLRGAREMAGHYADMQTLEIPDDWKFMKEGRAPDVDEMERKDIGGPARAWLKELGEG